MNVIQQGWVATTHKIPSRGFRLGPDVLEGLRDRIIANGMPMTGHHDSRLPVDHKILVAEIRDMDNGEQGLWVEFEVDDDAWQRLGDVRGFSISFFQAGPPDWPNAPEPDVLVSPDSYHWEDKDVREALETISAEFRVAGQHLHQFAGEPPAQIVIEMTMFFLTQLGPNLAASAIWDGIKLLWARRKNLVSNTRNIITFNVTNGERECIARIETSSETVAVAALDALDRAVQQVFVTLPVETKKPVITYEDGDAKWKVLSPGQE